VEVKRIIDTSAYVSLKRGDEDIAELLRGSEEIVFSLVVVAELLFGFLDGGRYKKNVDELEEFLRHPRVSQIGITRATAERFGRIATELKRQGTPIPTNDVWIAAQALETGCEVISLDRHFRHVPGLVVVPD
jgi:tRNA(fMet)-specific endonuclease VapC